MFPHNGASPCSMHMSSHGPCVLYQLGLCSLDMARIAKVLHIAHMCVQTYKSMLSTSTNSSDDHEAACKAETSVNEMRPLISY